jgi:hypothetical protein
MSPPSSGSRNKPRNHRERGGNRVALHADFVFGLFSEPKDEEHVSSETSVDFQRTTRRYIPEDRNLHHH